MSCYLASDDILSLLNTLFPLLIATPSKSLRLLLFQKILSDLRNANSKTKNHKLNRTVQVVLHNLVTSEPASPKGIWAVKLTRELWKRQVWTDAKAVEIMKEAALSQNAKVIIGGTRFFLGGDQEREEAAEEEDEEGDQPDMGQLRHQEGINKKSKKRATDLRKAAATVKRNKRKKSAPNPLNFSALHLLHDPQSFAESLFSQHLQPQNPKAKLNLDQKLFVLQLITRLIGLHKLTVVQLYSYFTKYLTPRQASVTSFLASLAQSTHNLVPPDLLEPLIQQIANEFVSEASAGEVASAGLNAIREICARQPLAMNQTLLQDLVQYRKSKDKGVMMAAKGLMGLYRDVGADLLRKQDRGKKAAMAVKSGEQREQRFGFEEEGRIEGLELLAAWKASERKARREEQGLDTDDEDMSEEDEAEGWKNWEAEDVDSDGSGGWINVSDDERDIELSDSDDEKPPANKKQKQSQSGEPVPAGNIASELKAAAKSETIDAATFASTRILTPADLAKLQELRTNSAVTDLLPGRTQRARPTSQAVARHADDPLTAAEIEGLSTLSNKMTKEQKIALAKGEKGEKHMSTTAMRKEKKESEGKSTTNKEKARKKNFLMTLSKGKKKGKRSLVEQRNILRGHVKRQKQGGRRGNA